MMESDKIEKTARYMCDDGERITIDAGKYEWQINWNGLEITHGRTKEADADANMVLAYHYLLLHRKNVKEIEHPHAMKPVILPETDKDADWATPEGCKGDVGCCCDIVAGKEEDEPAGECCRGGDACGDNRFKVIERAKKHLCYATNIESSPDEMKCLDSFLFRCWQMGWLRDYDNEKPAYEEMMEALSNVKDAFETDVIYAPGESPTYEQADKAREVYKRVCDALGKGGKEDVD